MGIGKVILRLFGIGRPKPKTKMARAFRWFERGVVLLCAIYGFLVVFPQILFAHTIETKGITVYSRTPLPRGAKATMDRVISAVSRSELYDERVPFCIFICNSSALYSFFVPFHPRSFGVSYPLTDNIFLAQVDLDRDRAYRSGSEYNERPFHSVVVHEMTHVLIRRHIGRIRDYRLPTWIKEGYCEYIAGGSSFPEDEGEDMLIAGQTSGSVAFQYFVWRKMVEYSLKEKHRSFRALAVSSEDPGQVIQEMRQWLLRKKTVEPPPAH